MLTCRTPRNMKVATVVSVIALDCAQHSSRIAPLHGKCDPLEEELERTLFPSFYLEAVSQFTEELYKIAMYISFVSFMTSECMHFPTLQIQNKRNGSSAAGDAIHAYIHTIIITTPTPWVIVVWCTWGEPERALHCGLSGAGCYGVSYNSRSYVNLGLRGAEGQIYLHLSTLAYRVARGENGCRAESFEFSLRSVSNGHYIKRDDSSSPLLPTINDIRCEIGNTIDNYSCPVYALQFQDALQSGWLKHSNTWVQIALARSHSV